ncbi:hypothetical protein COLO4_24119 [Corchorus olitorius]|uniref:Uncharacterized protein n=1 Tax=Corchorus olitorius TaxID=93759 RepID=A0A1R3ICW7_9ROSI|nr:hypothetical protein COLO4_24119 [Corchorus olitorius]
MFHHISYTETNGLPPMEKLTPEAQLIVVIAQMELETIYPLMGLNHMAAISRKTPIHSMLKVPIAMYLPSFDQVSTEAVLKWLNFKSSEIPTTEAGVRMAQQVEHSPLQEQAKQPILQKQPEQPSLQDSAHAFIPNAHPTKILVCCSRGAANTFFTANLSVHCEEHAPDLVVVIETRTISSKSRQLKHRLPFDSNETLHPMGFCGGSWLLWNSYNTNVQVLAKNPKRMETQVHSTIQMQQSTHP